MTRKVRFLIMDTNVHSHDENGNPPKKCTGPCGRTLPATTEFFHVRKASKDGFVSRCKICIRDYGKKYREDNKVEIADKKKRYQQENKDHIREYGKRYRQDNKDALAESKKRYAQDNKDYIREYKRLYFQNNKSRLRDLYRQYYQDHRERHNEYSKQYYLDNKDAVAKKKGQYAREHRNLFNEYNKKYYRTDRGRLAIRSNNHKRRARKKSSGGSYTPDQLIDQKKRQKNRCYWCGDKLGKEWHADHVFPLSRGGTNDISNIVIACPNCNLSKGAKLPHEWSQSGRLI
jgi:5-methylcytosine-specific restriction endonuclease McrA